MQTICEILDNHGNHACKNTAYQHALAEQTKVINDANLTPSARMINEMRENDDVFFALSSKYSKQHQDQLQNEKLTDNEITFFTQAAEESINKQKNIEHEDSLSFDDFLNEYFSQKNT